MTVCSNKWEPFCIDQDYNCLLNIQNGAKLLERDDSEWEQMAALKTVESKLLGFGLFLSIKVINADLSAVFFCLFFF